MFTWSGSTVESEAAALSKTMKCMSPIRSAYGGVYSRLDLHIRLSSHRYRRGSRNRNHPSAARSQLSWFPRTITQGALGRSFAAGANQSAFQRLQSYVDGTHLPPDRTASR